MAKVPRVDDLADVDLLSSLDPLHLHLLSVAASNRELAGSNDVQAGLCIVSILLKVKDSHVERPAVGAETRSAVARGFLFEDELGVGSFFFLIVYEREDLVFVLVVAAG